MCSPPINGEGELRGQPAKPGSPGKMAVKTECVCNWPIYMEITLDEDWVPIKIVVVLKFLESYDSLDQVPGETTTVFNSQFPGRPGIRPLKKT